MFLFIWVFFSFLYRVDFLFFYIKKTKKKNITGISIIYSMRKKCVEALFLIPGNFWFIRMK